MRFLVLIALCLAVASASYANRNRFNRLLRNMQHRNMQGQEQGFGNERLYSQYDDMEEQDQDQDQDAYQQFSQRQQCSRSQGCRGMNLQEDENEYDSEEQYGDEQDQYMNQRQGRQGRQGLQQDDDEQEQYQYQNQRQGRQGLQQDDEEQYMNQRQGRQGLQNQQQKRQQQQRHQCQPQYQLLQALELANTQLASKLYKQAKLENDDKNTVVSPAALQLALAAIQRGARGSTKRQLQRITCAGLNQQQSRHAHTALQQSLQGQGHLQQQSGQRQHAQVKATTTIVINQRTRAQQQFVQAVRACLNTQVKQCNFQQQPQQCRQQINRLVAQKTNQKLQQVVPQEAVTENTKMIVVNTAQVKALWGRQFRQQQQTKQGRFYPLGCQQPKPVQIMQAQGQFNYYEDAQMKVVGIPTQQQEMTLYVMVPKNKDGLNQMEKSQIQDPQQLKQLLEQAEQQRQQVQIELPKFQIKHKLDAKQTLRKEGVEDVFDADECDLSVITGQQQQQQHRRRQQQQYGQEIDEQEQYQQDGQQRQQQLHVNKLIHQATIKVDEQGIHAARPHQGQQQQQQQYQDQEQEQYPEQEQDEDQYDEDDEQGQQYMQQQFQRQQTFEQFFGRNQRQQRQHRNRRQPQFQGQYQDQDQDENQYGQGQQVQVRANRAFAFALKHNPSNQIVLVGRVVDAAQRQRQQPQHRQQQGQTLNGVDQQ